MWRCIKGTTQSINSTIQAKYSISFRPYRINFMFHRYANSVFMTNSKKNNCLRLRVHQTWGRGYVVTGTVYIVLFPDWDSVNYHVATVEDGSFFCCHNNGSLMARASIYMVPTSPHLLGRDPALCLAARLVIPCQFQNLSSFINVSTPISSKAVHTFISSSPTSCTSLSLLLLSSVLLTVKFFFLLNCPFANPEFTRL